MAKAPVIKSKTANGSEQAPPAGSPESLDQVRDILFGGQMRMVDARLQGLEERLMHEHASLRTDFGRRLAELEGYTKKELAGLTDRLAAERAKRADDLKALGAELKESLKSLERRHLKLEEAATQSDAELRDHLVRTSATLSGDLAKTAERISAELDRAASTLRNEKLDVAAFAAALTELSAKLTGTPRATGKGARG